MWVDFLGETEYRARELNRRQAIEDSFEIAGGGISHTQKKTGGASEWFRSQWSKWRVGIHNFFARCNPAVVIRRWKESRKLRSSEGAADRWGGRKRKLGSSPHSETYLVLHEWRFRAFVWRDPESFFLLRPPSRFFRDAQGSV